MEQTVKALAGVLDFAREIREGVDRVDAALPALRRLLEIASIAFRLVGGVAVVHHGYVRTTRHVNVLIAAEGAARLDPLLAEHGFERLSANRLRHRATGVDVDLLVSGEPMPRPGSPPYPAPETLAGSPSDPAVVGLPGLLLLKLYSARHQDLADVVALLKRLDEGDYLRVESALPAALRPQLADLRRDAQEELSWEGEERRR